MKKFYVLIFFFVLFLLFDSSVYAQELAAGSSAALLKPAALEASDSRVRILREFLEKYNSPLVPFAGTFVETADKYDLDWKLVAAISGVESTFGQQIPYESFNGWGWGIYGDNMIRFSSWNEGIETISQGLRTKYIDKWGAQDVYEIGRFYAASPTWAQRVEYFMNSIEEFGNSKLANLPISL
ncbi:MAG: hypothetical protein Q8P29_02645 [Candidatus Levybacteria bacterium]|nr:hypothetical protein [Candidatus Levybacteria bacterium]